MGGQRAADEHAHAVAHIAPHLVHRMLGIAALTHSVVGRVGQILQGIQKRTVQIKNNGVVQVFHGLIPPRLSPWA